MEVLLNMIFRAKRLILTVFATVFVCVLVILILKPDKYQAHMSFLVRNERADPLVSADPHQNSIQHGEVTEEDINSEVELLGSTQVLQQVVEKFGLQNSFEGRFTNERSAIERATRKLSKNLTITPVRKSSLIEVSYSSQNRDQSVAVLNELAARYLEIHANLHTAGNATSFFREKSLTIERALKSAEDKRAAFLNESGYSLLSQQKQLTLQQMLEAQKARDDTDASIAETSSRLKLIRSHQTSRLPRIVTQDRISANQYSVERLNTMLSELQNRRTELATKFRPGDRLLVQIEQEIADTRASLSDAEKISSEDKTTDVNPLRQSLDAEADRLQETRAGLISRRSDLDAQLSRQHDALGKMEKAGIYVDELDRDVKQLEDNLDLYRTKAVAAGIADDLDTAKISNVVIAAPPIVPALPASSPFNLFTGVLLALLVSLSAGFFSEMRSRRIYGPAAVESETGLPVLATLAQNPAS